MTLSPRPLRRHPRSTSARIRALDEALLATHGPQGWWPTTRRAGEAPRYRPGREGRAVGDREALEIVVGALLTQNTAWTNVVLALRNLTREHRLDLETLSEAGPWLEDLVRPSGYYRQKADRLRRTSSAILEAGGFRALRREPTQTLRNRFLAWHGVGPETADSFLCYAFSRPVFIVDAYTRRLFRAHRLPDGAYEDIRAAVEEALAPDPGRLGDFHARIVRNFTCNRGLAR